MIKNPSINVFVSSYCLIYFGEYTCYHSFLFVKTCATGFRCTVVLLYFGVPKDLTVASEGRQPHFITFFANTKDLFEKRECDAVLGCFNY
jgi:hypothetical protein